MKKKYLYSLLIILMISFSLFANAQTEQQSQQRIVSLSPGMTELVYALGCGDNLVARTDYCNYPSDCLSVPSVGDSWKPNVEVIVSYEPTVVLVSSLTDPQTIESMEKAGLNVQRIVFEDSLEGTYDLIKEVGIALGKESEAVELAETTRKRINDVISLTKDLDQRKSCVYIIGWGTYGDFAATGDTFINDVIEAAGGINIAKDSLYWSISREVLVDGNPELIFLPSYSYQNADIEGFKTTEPYSKLTGVIVEVNGDAAERQGLRTADTIENFAKYLYPELFK